MIAMILKQIAPDTMINLAHYFMYLLYVVLYYLNYANITFRIIIVRIQANTNLWRRN